MASVGNIRPINYISYPITTPRSEPNTRPPCSPCISIFAATISVSIRFASRLKSASEHLISIPNELMRVWITGSWSSLPRAGPLQTDVTITDSLSSLPQLSSTLLIFADCWTAVRDVNTLWGVKARDWTGLPRQFINILLDSVAEPWHA